MLEARFGVTVLEDKDKEMHHVIFLVESMELVCDT